MRQINRLKGQICQQHGWEQPLTLTLLCARSFGIKIQWLHPRITHGSSAYTSHGRTLTCARLPVRFGKGEFWTAKNFLART
jgi:hypothetical protein